MTGDTKTDAYSMPSGLSFSPVPEIRRLFIRPGTVNALTAREAQVYGVGRTFPKGFLP